MTKRSIVALGASTALLAISSTASAQRWGRERTPNDGACFYEDANFGGNYFCVRAGESLGSLGAGMNDCISSMRNTLRRTGIAIPLVQRSLVRGWRLTRGS